MTKVQQEVSEQKALRKKVKSQLGFALNDLTSLMSEEQFKKRIKKAAKLITEGLPEAVVSVKQESPKAIPAKKAAIKKIPVKKAAVPPKKVVSAAAKKAAIKK